MKTIYFGLCSEKWSTKYSKAVYAKSEWFDFDLPMTDSMISCDAWFILNF